MPRLKQDTKIDINQHLKKKIKKMCAERGITVKEAVEKAGFTNINYYEKANRGTIRYSDIVIILNYLDATDEEKLELLNVK